MKQPNAVTISGKEVLPLVEGGKGIFVSNGNSAGAWAAEDAVGTISAVIPDKKNEDGSFIQAMFNAKRRKDRHEEFITNAIDGTVDQIKVAHEKSNGKGRIHVNMLWELGGSQQILDGVLKKTKGLLHGITAGAGLPFKLSDIAAKYKVHYYPIVSSARTFKILWMRAYQKTGEFLGGVVYEDPWLAGGHNGLSNAEDPNKPEDPFPRVAALRKQMNEVGLHDTPIIMAGGIWNLKEWEGWFDNEEIGKVAFQFGTRPLLTQESPVAKTWYQKLMDIKPADILTQHFSPTGFISSAIKNGFMNTLVDRVKTEIKYYKEKRENTEELEVSPNQKIWISKEDVQRAMEYIKNGFRRILKTPDETVLFVDEMTEKEINEARAKCVGCLSQCRFSGWSQTDVRTGKVPDPRSFCIHQKLQTAVHTPEIENGLLFSGKIGARFKDDPMYKDGHIPTVRELIQALLQGK